MPFTIRRLANGVCRFTTELDSSKTGLRIKRKVLADDGKIAVYRLPDCMEAVDSADGRGLPIIRHASLGPFILDILLEAGHQMKKKHLIAYDNLKKDLDHKKDPDLCQPFLEASNNATEAAKAGFPYLARDLAAIRSHVDSVYNSWCVAAREIKKSSPQNISPQKSTPKKGRKHLSNQGDAMFDITKQFAHGPNNLSPFTTAVDDIKASYAYERYHSWQKADYFAFNMAFKHLTIIKARAKGPVGMTLSFGESMTMSTSLLRAMEAAQEPLG
jgi:RNA-dependent RNA polymerase